MVKKILQSEEIRKIIIAAIIVCAAAILAVFLRGEQKNQPLAEQTGSFFDTRSVDEGEPDKAYLFDVTTNTASGLAKRVYSVGEFIHTVNIDLPVPEDGSYYGGWLAEGEGEQQKLVKTGKMINMNEEYFLAFEKKEDLRSYSQVIITRESGESETPGEIVATGSF